MRSPLIHLLATATILIHVGCDDCSRRRAQPRGVAVTAPRHSEPEPAPDDKLAMRLWDQPRVELASLPPEQQRWVKQLLALLRHYSPTWDREQESEDDFYTRWPDTPEVRRCEARIERHWENDRAWRALLFDARRALGAEYIVRGGTPPGFYIPSNQLVIISDHPDGSIAMVFRLSMLAPLYDYYESIRRPDQLWLRGSLDVREGDPEVVRRARELIAVHFPEHRLLAPELGMTDVPDMRSENTLLGETSLADLLFGDGRSW
ncbi:hypothetical protein [Haliangium sp.]|uniref:hypothetical protein n=1 Tax=Haliangium sp. TaxID=2663208 RepID=UPI003D0FCE0C